MTNRCPFCTNYAYAVSVGDAYQLDCRYCDIQIEITKRAYSARCPDPVGVLDYIREKLKGSTRPRVDLADMKRRQLPTAPIQEEEMTVNDTDALTTAAKAIGTTLGKLAVKTGIVTPPAELAKPAKKVAAKKKAPAAKVAAVTKRRLLPKKRPASPPPRRSLEAPQDHSREDGRLEGRKWLKDVPRIAIETCQVPRGIGFGMKGADLEPRLSGQAASVLVAVESIAATHRSSGLLLSA